MQPMYQFVRVDLGKMRRLRRRAGLTQADMAKALGYKTAIGYHYLEAGRRRVSAERLGTIAMVLRVPVADLLVVAEPTPGNSGGLGSVGARPVGS